MQLGFDLKFCNNHHRSAERRILTMAYNTNFKEVYQHQWFLEMDFPCSKMYDQFLNWLDMEFYFFQQENGSFLTIYFPNGQVKVEKTRTEENTFTSEITVKSKCQKFGLKMRKTFSAFLDYMESYHRLSQTKH